MRCGYRTCLMPIKLPLLFQHVQYISKIKRTDDLLGKGLEFRVVLLHTHPEERGPLLEPDIYSRGTWALAGKSHNGGTSIIMNHISLRLGFNVDGAAGHKNLIPCSL